MKDNSLKVTLEFECGSEWQFDLAIQVMSAILKVLGVRHANRHKKNRMRMEIEHNGNEEILEKYNLASNYEFKGTT